MNSFANHSWALDFYVFSGLLILPQIVQEVDHDNKTFGHGLFTRVENIRELNFFNACFVFVFFFLLD